MITEPIGYGVTGKWGKYIYTSRNGTYYKKRYTKPRNPQTKKQMQWRNLFARAMKAWQELSQKEKLKWKKRACNVPKAGHNLFISHFLFINKVRNFIFKEKTRHSLPSPPFYLFFITPEIASSKQRSFSRYGGHIPFHLSQCLP